MKSSLINLLLPTTIGRVDSASLSLSLEDCSGAVRNSVDTITINLRSLDANSEAKAAVLERAFAVRGTHFYNQIEAVVVWAFLNSKHKDDTHSEYSYFIPFMVFLPTLRNRRWKI